MFTGLIEGLGEIASRETRGGDARLRIAVGTLPFEGAALGESIAVNGVCLTVVSFDTTHFEVDARGQGRGHVQVDVEDALDEAA